MPKGTESVKTAQPQKFGSVTTTPPKEIKSIHSIPFYNIKNHQPLYSEEVLT